MSVCVTAAPWTAWLECSNRAREAPRVLGSRLMQVSYYNIVQILQENVDANVDPYLLP